MPNLFFEIYSEEMPSEMQEFGASKIYDLLIKQLNKIFQINLSGEYFFTPKRIGIYISEIPDVLCGSDVEIRGPKINATDKAIQGFLSKYKIADISKLFQKGEYYFFKEKFVTKDSKGILKSLIEDIITSFNWPKSMRWGDYDIRWIRPIHSMICIFDKTVLPIKFGHVIASNKIKIKDKIIIVESFEDYKKKFEEIKVCIFQDKRLKIIKDQAKELCKQFNISLIEDNNLLKEVSNLVESPYVAIGKIEKRFMKLPKEILVSMLKFHQKYLMTEDNNGNLAPYFIIVSNGMTNDNLKTVINGNEKVLRSRLADAEYFYNQDSKTKLIDKFDKLKKVTFHHEIGSYYDKISDVKKIALKIADKLQINDKDNINRASLLIKSDLVTEIVNELPELQGIAGYYYALNDEELQDVANAIKDHYLPQGPSDSVPNSPLSIVMALADKIVTLNSMFAINIKPTGSKDPYALRRAAIGIIRIICSNKLKIDLKDIIDKEVIKFINDRVHILSNSANNIYSIDLEYIKNAI